MLNFLGFRIYGFKRKSRFFSLLIKFRYSKLMKNSLSYFFAIIFSLFVIISYNVNVSFVSGFYKKASSFFIPVKYFAKELVVFPKSLTEYAFRNNTLRDEIKSLRSENDSLKIKLTTMKSFEKEFSDLKKAVDLRYSLTKYKIIERVLGFDSSAFESFLLVSSTHESVKEGSVVLSSDGLVGIVYDIKSKIARVMDVSDSKLNVPVKSLTGEHLILSGNGKGSMISKEVKQDESFLKINLKKGDLLYTSGEGGVFSSEIPVAVVESITPDNKVIATPVSGVDNISFVWITDPVLNKNMQEN